MSKTVKKQKTVEELLDEALVPIQEQPYVVPDNWRWLYLQEAVENIQYGYTESSTYDKVGPHFLRITDIQNDRVNWDEVPYCTIEEKQKKKYKLESGDIVVARTGATTGKSYLIENPPDVVFASYLIRLRSSKLLNPKYLWMFMRGPQYWKQIMVVKKGSTQPGANAKILGKLNLPLPPLNEQKRIADKVECLLNKINEAKQLIDEAKETFELRRAAILDKAFRGELGTNDPKEAIVNISGNQGIVQPEEHLFSTPQNWLWVKSEIVAKWGSGGTPSRKKPEYYGGDIPWLKTGELRDKIIYESEETITDDAIKNSSAKVFPKGSVAIAMYGATIGRTGVLGIEAATNQACAVGVPNQYTNTEFMFYYFFSQKQKLIDKGKGGAQPNISQTIIKAFPFPLPPSEEQKRIVNKIKSLLGKLDVERQLTHSLNNQLETTKQSILFKAFCGELGTNVDTEESIIELLKEDLQK